MTSSALSRPSTAARNTTSHTTVRALTVALVIAVIFASLAIGSPASAADTPALSDPPVATTTLTADQLTLQITLADLQVAQARQDVLVANDRMSLAALDVSEAQIKVTGATAVRNQDRADANTAKRRMADLGAAAYRNSSSGSFTTLLQAHSILDMARMRRLATASFAEIHRQYRAANRRLAISQRALDTTVQSLKQTQVLYLDTKQAYATATQTLKGLEATSQNLRSGAAITVAAGVDLSPSLLGPPHLTANDLVRWYNATGHSPNLTVPLATLAQYFIEEGKAEGVRGDIAFAQSIIETGYFGFPSGGQVAVADNNFAGINACDSCAHGSSFADARTGVRAQMQLLHGYADKNLTVAALANPPALGDPAKFSARGCCQTWMALSGVWATGPGYGEKILRLYTSMVQSALAARIASPPVADPITVPQPISPPAP